MHSQTNLHCHGHRPQRRKTLLAVMKLQTVHQQSKPAPLATQHHLRHKTYRVYRKSHAQLTPHPRRRWLNQKWITNVAGKPKSTTTRPVASPPRKKKQLSPEKRTHHRSTGKTRCPVKNNQAFSKTEPAPRIDTQRWWHPTIRQNNLGPSPHSWTNWKQSTSLPNHCRSNLEPQTATKSSF